MILYAMMPTVLGLTVGLGGSAILLTLLCTLTLAIVIKRKRHHYRKRQKDTKTGDEIKETSFSEVDNSKTLSSEATTQSSTQPETIHKTEYHAKYDSKNSTGNESLQSEHITLPILITSSPTHNASISDRPPLLAPPHAARDSQATFTLCSPTPVTVVREHADVWLLLRKQESQKTLWDSGHYVNDQYVNEGLGPSPSH